MKIMKKIVLVSSILVVAILVACGGGTAVTPADGGGTAAAPDGEAAPEATPEAAADEPIELTYWTIVGWRPNQWEYVVERWADIEPNVTIDVVVNSTDDHKSNLMLAAAAGAMPSFWFNWGGSLADFFPENHLTRDLTQHAIDNNWDQIFYAEALELSTLAGQLTGAPHGTTAFGVFYDRRAFARAGITEHPVTFAEFEAALEALHDAGIIPIAAGGRNGWQVYRLIEKMIEMNLGSDLHYRLNHDWDTDIWLHDGVTETFAAFQRFVDSGFYPEGFITGDPNDARALLYNELAAIMIGGSAEEMNSINDGQNPDDFGWFPFPAPAGGNRMTSFVHMNQFCITLTDAEFYAAMAVNHFAYSPEVVESLGFVQQPIPRFDNVSLYDFPISTKIMETLDERGSFTITDQALPQEVVNRLFEIMDNVALGAMEPSEVGPSMKQFHDNWILMNP